MSSATACSATGTCPFNNLKQTTASSSATQRPDCGTIFPAGAKSSHGSANQNAAWTCGTTTKMAPNLHMAQPIRLQPGSVATPALFEMAPKQLCCAIIWPSKLVTIINKPPTHPASCLSKSPWPHTREGIGVVVDLLVLLCRWTLWWNWWIVYTGLQL